MNQACGKDWIDKTFRRVMLGFSLPDPKAQEILRSGPAEKAQLGISQSHYDNQSERRELLTKVEEWMDPGLYVRTLKRLGIQVFYHHAKNHSGVSCYPTKVGFPYSLMGERDFFGELVSACRKAGIVPGAMYQVGMDHLSAVQHPGWRQQDATGKTTLFRLCPNNPQWRARVLGQTREIVSYDIGAFMYDELSFGWGNIGTACYCPHCRALFRKGIGEDMPEKEDWESPLWKRFVRWRYDCISRFLEEAAGLIRAVNPDVAFTEVYYAEPNQGWKAGWASEPTSGALDYVLVDSVVPGVLSARCRYYRAISARRPEIAVGSALSLKTPDYGYNDNEMHVSEQRFLADLMTVLANGTTPGFESMGWYNRRFWSKEKATMPSPGFERLYLRGVREIRKREPWLTDAEPVPHAALLYSENSRDFYGRGDQDIYLQCYYGWYKALMDRQVLFDVVLDGHVTSERLAPYALLVLPEAACLSDRQIAVIRDYVRSGGGLVASHATSLMDGEGNRRNNFGLSDVFGVSYASGLEEDYNLQVVNPARRDQVFLHFDRPHRLLNGVAAPGERFTLPAASLLVRKTAGAEGVGSCHMRRKEGAGASYEGRMDAISGHGRDEATDSPAVVLNRFGRGKAVYFPGKIGCSYSIFAHPAFHRLMVNAARLAASGRAPVEVTAPRSVEMTAFFQRRGKRLVVHLVNYQSAPYRLTLNNNMPFGGEPPVEEILPVYDIQVRVDVSRWGRPKAVYEAPGRKKLTLRNAGRGHLIACLLRLDIHSMLIFEYA